MPNLRLLVRFLLLSRGKAKSEATTEAALMATRKPYMANRRMVGAWASNNEMRAKPGAAEVIELCSTRNS